MKIIGVDVDGVLADFNEGYRRTLCEVGGRDGFCHEPQQEDVCWEPPMWFYREHFGYSADEDARAWEVMLDSPTYWQTLRPYPGASAFLHALRHVSGEIYFITTRPGQTCKFQTEVWLQSMGFYRPTVLIARGDKGAIARGLRLTHFVDDRPENCFAVKNAFDDDDPEKWPSCSVSLFARRYNVSYQDAARLKDIRVITSLEEFLTEVRK